MGDFVKRDSGLLVPKEEPAKINPPVTVTELVPLTPEQRADAMFADCPTTCMGNMLGDRYHDPNRVSINIGKARQRIEQQINDAVACALAERRGVAEPPQEPVRASDVAGLIEALRLMPPTAKVGYIWDGCMRAGRRLRVAVSRRRRRDDWVATSRLRRHRPSKIGAGRRKRGVLVRAQASLAGLKRRRCRGITPGLRGGDGCRSAQTGNRNSTLWRRASRWRTS